MSTTCSLPPRYHTGISADPRLQTAAARLAEALEVSAEYREFTRLSEAVNADPDVYALIEQMRQARASYSLSHGGELEARLEALPVMAAYRRAETALRDLLRAVDEAIGAGAGMEFCRHVRPQGHG